MKAFLASSAVAFLILAAPAAFAADNDKNKDNTSHVTDHQSGKAQKGKAGETGEPKVGKTGVHTGTGQTGNPNARGGTPGGAHHHQGSGSATQSSSGSGPNGNGPNGNAPLGNGPHGNAPGGHAGKHHGNPQAAMSLRHFHQNMRAQHRFHMGSYHAPHGYRYRHWTFGMTLPTIYFAQDYWISDYSDYGLDDPPDGYVWVRYGPDALLIDEDTGEIVEVEYGVFY